MILSSARLPRQLLLSVLLLAGTAAVFWPTLAWMAERFAAQNSFYSHGWLVPLVSVWLVWRRRDALQACERRSSAWGLALLVPALVLHTLGVAWQIGFLGGFALVAGVWGLVWACWGRQTVRVLRVPLAFLLFMVPLPSALLLDVSFRLKLLAAHWATIALQVMGIPAEQGGSIILVPGLRVVVDDTCSGLRSLISLTALATLWAIAMLPPSARLWQRLVLMGSALPIALFANAVRIVALVLIGTFFGSRMAEGFIHTGSGLLVFAVALVALAGLGRWMRR